MNASHPPHIFLFYAQVELMNYKRRNAASIHLEAPTIEHCNCLPLSALHKLPSQPDEENSIDYEQVTLATQELDINLRAQLAPLFPRSTPLSLLLLHVSQLEHIHLTSQSTSFRRRQRYHAPPGFLEQVLANIRRTLRTNDQFLVHEGTGAAIIFPEVDQQGMQNILDRIYHSVSLLQAETVIPPLKRETDIVMGIASYPESAASLERLLYQVGVMARKFTLRPAITTQLWSTQSTHLHTIEVEDYPPQDNQGITTSGKASTAVPFMNLPAQLPRRLKQLIPYSIALELQCAPVGRDHHCLTIAMADPTNSASIAQLREMTGLTIFPVSCDLSALNALLANRW
jgi:type II secretion system (T2SS) protein E